MDKYNVTVTYTIEGSEKEYKFKTIVSIGPNTLVSEVSDIATNRLFDKNPNVSDIIDCLDELIE